MQVDPHQTIVLAHQAEHASRSERDPTLRGTMVARSQWLAGEAYLRIDETDMAAPLVESALQTIEKTDPRSKLHGDLLLSLGGIATARGDVSQALTAYHNAHAIFRRIGETRSEAKALIQIASLYYMANDWQGALKYHGEALDTFNADPGLTAAIHNGRGNALKELGRDGEAQAELAAALKLARQMKSRSLEATILRNIARMALASGDLARADRAMADSVRAAGTDAPPEFQRQQAAVLAQAAYQHGDVARAGELIGQVFAGADLTKTTLADRDAHRTAYLTYEKIGRDDLALAHLRALKRLDDDATTLARSTGAALMSARFDFANQALKIANLKADDAQKSAAYERQNAQTQRWIFLGASGATMILIAMLLYALRVSRRSRTRVQVANEELAVTNQALGKALAAKTEFLATTSHEIRTPLNGILGMTQVMLVDRSLDPVTRDRLSIVQDAGTAMKALVDDILDVAKMESGNLTIEDRPFDLRRMIVAACDMWSSQAQAKGLTFDLTVDDCPGLVTGDEQRLRQILFNLLSNAIKFTPDGNVALSVDRSAGGACRFTISDSGIGIAPDKMEAIFDPFRQADSSTTRRFGGSGLGLTISRSLADAMGGSIAVTSVVEQGTTFIVELPLPGIDQRDDGPDERTAVPSDLLIIDRNPLTRAMLKSMLAAQFTAIEVAADVDEAIGLLAIRSTRAVLFDASGLAADDVHERSARLIGANQPIVALLWPAIDEDRLATADLPPGVTIILKPITGIVLAQRLVALFPPTDDHLLVSEAA